MICCCTETKTSKSEETGNGNAIKLTDLIICDDASSLDVDTSKYVSSIDDEIRNSFEIIKNRFSIDSDSSSVNDKLKLNVFRKELLHLFEENNKKMLNEITVRSSSVEEMQSIIQELEKHVVSLQQENSRIKQDYMKVLTGNLY